MRSISHLRHHSQTGVLHYRRVVPPELRPIIGKATISGTLGSKTLDHAALIRWVEIDRDAEQRLADARQQLAGQPSTENRPDDGAHVFIDVRRCMAAFEDWKQRKVGTEAGRLYSFFGRSDGNGLADFRRGQLAERSALGGLNYQTASAGFDEKLSTALLAVSISVPVDHVIWPTLRALFRAAWLDAITILDDLTAALNGRVQSGIVSESEPEIVVAAPFQQNNIPIPVIVERRQVSARNPRLSELVEAYLVHCEAEDDYAADLRMYARRLRESLGEDRIASAISKRDMISFMGQISRLPSRLTRAERKMTLEHLVAAVDSTANAKTVRGRLSQKTTDKWFQCLGAMFRFGQSHEFCDLNPTEGIKRHRKKNAEPARQHFEQDELRMIFSSPLYQGNDGDPYRCRPGGSVTKDAKYWLPLLGLFTGCRRDEMVQARAADVKEQGGIHYLHIATASDDGGRAKKVKTANSRRMVPLHNAIIDTGFLQYLADVKEHGELYLFPEIDQSVKEPAGSFGKWFDRFCARVAKINCIAPGTAIDAPTRTFHSFRHSFKRACRDAEIGKDIHDELTGHVGSGDVGSGYGRSGDGRFSLEVLNNAIQKVRYSGYIKPAQ